MKNAAKRQLLFWICVAALFIVMIALLNDILLPFIVAIGVAYFLDPLVDRLETYGLSRTVATLVLVILAGLVLVVSLIILLPLLADQLKSLIASLPDQFQTIKGYAEKTGRAWFGDEFTNMQTGLDAAMLELTQEWRSSAGEIIVKLLSGGMAVLNVLSLMLITPVVTFYMLADWEKTTASIDSWLPRDHAPTIRKLLGEINDVIAGFVRGQGTVCLILAVFYSLGLMLVGLKYSLLIGIVAGFAAFVPYVGAGLSFLLVGAVGLHQFLPEWMPIAQVFGVMIAGQMLEGTILSPRIVGGHVRLHPVWLIFSLFVFAFLFGFVGLLVAVPTAAALGVVTRYGLQEYLKSEFYQGAGKSNGDNAGAANSHVDITPAPAANSDKLEAKSGSKGEIKSQNRSQTKSQTKPQTRSAVKKRRK